MDEFYSDDTGEIFEKETYVVKSKDSENDIPVKWKEATTQMDYGIDISTSSVLLTGEVMDGTLYDITTRIRGLINMRDDSKKDEPINLLINSDGGSVYEALGIIDFINNINSKLYRLILL